MSCCPKNAEARADSTVYNYQYDQLKNLTHYKCEPGCFCRFLSPRSDWDQMEYNWMEKGKKPHIRPASAAFMHSWSVRK